MEGFLGGDVSKGYIDIVAIDSDFNQLDGVLQLDDTREGHDRLGDWIRGLFKKHGLARLSCAVESTGGLENNWHAALVGLSSMLPVRVARLNPSTVKNAAKAELSPNVTDAISARNIAMYIRRYDDRVDYGVKDAKYAAYRSLNNHICLVRKQKTQLLNELKQLLYSGFPEILAHCGKGIPGWVLRLIEKYPCVPKLAKARPASVAGIKGITPEKAANLVESAKGSVHSRATATDGFLLGAIAGDIARLDERLKALKAHLAKACTGPEVTLLQTITGMGAYSAAAIMAEIEDIRLFASPSKLSAFFGLHPRIKDSGDKKGVPRMSKQGRPAMRAVLYMCARTAVIHDPNMKAIHARHIARGKKDRQAIGVVMHKLLRAAWGVLNSGRPYSPEIDIANQERNPQKAQDQLAMETKAKRRMQPFDASAPVSRTARKKRKELIASQSGNAEKVRDSAKAPVV